MSCPISIASRSPTSLWKSVDRQRTGHSTVSEDPLGRTTTLPSGGPCREVAARIRARAGRGLRPNLPGCPSLLRPTTACGVFLKVMAPASPDEASAWLLETLLGQVGHPEVRIEPSQTPCLHRQHRLRESLSICQNRAATMPFPPGPDQRWGEGEVRAGDRGLLSCCEGAVYRH